MGSLGTPSKVRASGLVETSCGYLLAELQMIWDEVGEDQPKRENILLELEQECLEVYRRKVDKENILRAHLHQELAVSEAELTHLLLLLGERSLPERQERMTGTLKEQLESITPALKEMQLRKEERLKQFRAVQGQIQKISAQIAGESEYKESSSNVIVDETDLSHKKLEEYQTDLQRLLKEKGNRLQKVERYIGTIKNLSATLGMDSSMIITKVHPSLNELSALSKNITDGILTKLYSTLESLETEKHTRLEKLRQLGKALINLWDLMDTPYADRQNFSHIMTLLSFSCAEISDPGSLTVDIIQEAETEVKRLDQLKASKMKELFLRKQMELEDICNKSHMEIPSTLEKISDLINSGEIDHVDLLASMDDHISKAEEEALSRKVIMEKIEKWILARNEELWLEEYNRDENRYSVHRGAHKNLRRAERARLMVHKIPDLVDLLISKTKNWEEERKKVFLYDKVPLMAMLEEYDELRKLKEYEQQRQREMKKVQSQIELGQGNPLGSRPSTSSRRLSDSDMNQNEAYSNTSPRNTRPYMCSQQLGSLWNCSPNHEKYLIKAEKKGHMQKFYTRNGLPRHIKDDAVSVVSSFSLPMSP
ncbi:non-motor microtubule binding protein [Lithospermum erythrorhizon]|uniref:Non-motor microtubule binding protein n=1 Tax=Lithospermum erythrorhizon TaxID=34254 RepID=A0AAV3NKT9_LITER